MCFSQSLMLTNENWIYFLNDHTQVQCFINFFLNKCLYLIKKRYKFIQVNLIYKDFFFSAVWLFAYVRYLPLGWNH